MTTPSTRHPGGLYVLFGAEMWERFSFYGMKAFLILYMTAAVTVGGLEWSTEKAGMIYGWYTGLVYLTPIIGGYLADRMLGTHRSMVIGGLIIAAGHFTLAFESIATFYAGLALVVIGTGFFKPCVSVMVGQLYEENDPRRDSAFTIFYMGINLGAFLGPLVCGGLRFAKQTEDGIFGWHWAFGAAGVGMILGLIVYMIGRPFLLKGVGLKPQHVMDRESGVKKPLTSEDRDAIKAIFLLAFFVIFFWTAFEQAGGSMNLFAENRTDRSIAPNVAQWIHSFSHDPSFWMPWWLLTGIGLLLLVMWSVVEYGGIGDRVRPLQFGARLLGLATGAIIVCVGLLKGTGFLGALFPDTLLENAEYPTEWFQSANPMFILLLAPIFASIWVRLAAKGREPSTAVKFGLGLLLLGGGFVFMVLGAQASQAGDEIVKVGGHWLLAAYCVHTMGELCLSPVGLSAVTKLAPVHFVSLLMGVWFFANFVSNLCAGLLTGYSERIAETGFLLDGLAGFFLLFVIIPAVAGVVILAFAPKLKTLMHGRA